MLKTPEKTKDKHYNYRKKISSHKVSNFKQRLDKITFSTGAPAFAEKPKRSFTDTLEEFCTKNGGNFCIQ